MKPPFKKSDLNPPLGYPGGPCQVIQRIHSTVRNPKLRDELVDDVEGYKGLSNTDATKVYKLEVEKGAKAKLLQRIRITPHAQYRMDQRGITVSDVRVALMHFAKEFYDSKSHQGSFYQNRSEELARGEKILWVAKKIGRLAIVFVSAGQGTLTLVTSYWEGLSDPKPVDESVCKVAQRFALRQAPSPGVQTYVTYKSQLDLPNNKDNSDKEPPSALPLPGSATPGGAGRDIGKFEFNTPGPNSDIKPRTLGTPGAERGHPTNFITPGTMSRRTMTACEEDCLSHTMVPSAVVVAALYEVLAYSTGTRGGPQPTRQHRQRPADARVESRKYKQQKALRTRKALKRYHTFCKRNRQCLRQREMYRNSPGRYKRRPPGNKESGDIFLYDQENPANNEIKQPGADVNYRADSPSTYEKKPDEREGVPPGAYMPSNQTENVPAGSSRVIPDQMKDTLREQQTYMKAGASRGPGVSKWTAANKIYDQVRDIEYGSAKVIRRKGTEWLMTYRTSSGEERKVLVGGHESGAGQVSLSVRKYGAKTACVIGAGEFEGRNCLLKVRDRNYAPAVRIIRDLVNGVEVAYLLDLDTDWSEGLNEHGIGVVSSALMVIEDETVKKERTKAPDGIKIRKILGEDSLGSAVNEAVKNGVTGHTFIASPTEIATIEMDGDRPEVRILDTADSKVAVRTNHGEDIPEAGYTDGPEGASSKSRKQQAEKHLHSVKTVAELGVSLPSNRRKDRHHPHNVIRDADMFTSSIAVVDPGQLTMALYLVPGKIDFYGIENRLPKGHTPKIQLDIFSFSASEWEKDKPTPTLIPGDLGTFRLFTFGSLMGDPSFPKHVLRSYAATLPGHHRAYNRSSEERGGTLVVGTEPGGSLQGVVHDYPVEIAQRLLGQVDSREGFDRSRDEDENAYLRGYYPVQVGGKTEWVVAYLSNPLSKNYFDPLTPAAAAKRIDKEGKAALNYLRGIGKAMQKHKVTDPYLSKVLDQVGKGKTASPRRVASRHTSVKTALFPVELTDEKDHPGRGRDESLGFDTCSELPNGQENGQEKTAAANVEDILSNCGLQLKGRAQDVSYGRKRLSPSGMSTWVASGSRGERYTIKIKPIRKDKRIKAFAKVPIQVSCSCPYFRWQGPEHWAKKHGFLHGRQVGTASTPNIKDPKGRHWACKHVIAVLELARKWRYASEDVWTYEGDIVPMADPAYVVAKWALQNPPLEWDETKVKFKIRSTSDAVALEMRYAGKRIGHMIAHNVRYPEEKDCPRDVTALAKRFPELVTGEWKRSNGEVWRYITALAVFKAFITDEEFRGQGIGKKMYKALMGVWFKKVGPFLFMPYKCDGGSGTSPDAMRVWHSLSKEFPSSGAVVVVLRAP